MRTQVVYQERRIRHNRLVSLRVVYRLVDDIGCLWYATNGHLSYHTLDARVFLLYLQGVFRDHHAVNLAEGA